MFVATMIIIIMIIMIIHFKLISWNVNGTLSFTLQVKQLIFEKLIIGEYF